MVINYTIFPGVMLQTIHAGTSGPPGLIVNVTYWAIGKLFLKEVTGPWLWQQPLPDGFRQVNHALEVMMMSSNGNIFRVTVFLCVEFTCHRWIPLTNASDAELWFFSVICPWRNGWANHRDAGDLRRPRANFDVTVMWHANPARFTDLNVSAWVLSLYRMFKCIGLHKCNTFI